MRRFRPIRSLTIIKSSLHHFPSLGRIESLVLELYYFVFRAKCVEIDIDEMYCIILSTQLILSRQFFRARACDGFGWRLGRTLSGANGQQNVEL